MTVKEIHPVFFKLTMHDVIPDFNKMLEGSTRLFIWDHRLWGKIKSFK